ncbi:MAG: thioredoxin-dependent thiol peroxidase [Bacteroidaceae bacterium]|nr:thioredoxin-dependent thiol peroxidase [Bacteroidaceae bacterium]
MITIGDKVPDLLGRDENGKELRLGDFAGRKIALYFYPKDNTSGCTAEACSLRDHRDELRQAGYEVIGVSVQDEASHRKFIDKHALNFPLIADTDHKLVEAFGVWQEKSLYGRKFMGTMRTTFLIDESGIVTHVFGPKQIKTKIHAEQLLDAVKG